MLLPFFLLPKDFFTAKAAKIAKGDIFDWARELPNQNPQPFGALPISPRIASSANSYDPIRFLGLDHKKLSSRSSRLRGSIIYVENSIAHSVPAQNKIYLVRK